MARLKMGGNAFGDSPLRSTTPPAAPTPVVHAVPTPPPLPLATAPVVTEASVAATVAVPVPAPVLVSPAAVAPAPAAEPEATEPTRKVGHPKTLQQRQRKLTLYADESDAQALELEVFRRRTQGKLVRTSDLLREIVRAWVAANLPSTES